MNNLYNQKIWEISTDFITSIFVSWKDFAAAFGVLEEWDLLDNNETPPLDVIETAFHEAAIKSDDETLLIETENKILDDIIHHWSANNIIPQHIDFESLIQYLNSWSQEGAKDKNLFPVEPALGIAVEYFIHKTGISFTLFPPFMIPYTELYYEEFRELPEWNLEDISKTDIAETFYILYFKLFGHLNINLADWDQLRSKKIENS